MPYILIILFGVILMPHQAHAQDTSPYMENAPSEITALSEARIDSQRRHLYRIGSWGTLNAVAGGATWSLSDNEQWRSFGMQSSLWGAINLGIATAGLFGASTDPVSDYSEALRAERNYSDILLVNLGLNVGYIGVGAAMYFAGTQGVSRSASWRGHGSAIVMQGIGLFVLDLITWLASRDRLNQLTDYPEM